MKLEVFDDADSVARAAAATIAAEARAAIAARGRFTLAVSGGHTPWIMLRALASEDIPWAGVHVFQVDERVAPDGHPDRNLTHLRESLLQHAPLRPEQIHAMPVESADLEAAATQYGDDSRGRLPDRRRCSISSTSVSAPTATRPRWCRAMRYSVLPTRTWR